jgi:predicted nucleotidyltransferase
VKDQLNTSWAGIKLLQEGDCQATYSPMHWQAAFVCVILWPTATLVDVGIGAIMPLTKDDVLALLAAHTADLDRLGVQRYGLFGSFVRQQQRADSDIDLLVDFRPGQKTFNNFMRLADFLEGLFGRRVELVTREALSPHIGPHILAEVEYATVDA